VILNLVTNAFYAANEKFSAKSTATLPSEASSKEVPTVTVSTRKTPSGVEVTVKDNGNGITQKVMDKIFQPFFTTKPAGQGTGLGLSLSYDIIKAHGGELKVDSIAGEYASFTIRLPLL
jgi:signal transduction histidine kinase